MFDNDKQKTDQLAYTVSRHIYVIKMKNGTKFSKTFNANVSCIVNLSCMVPL